jgi:hypothetical protein
MSERVRAADMRREAGVSLDALTAGANVTHEKECQLAFAVLSVPDSVSPYSTLTPFVIYIPSL